MKNPKVWIAVLVLSVVVAPGIGLGTLLQMGLPLFFAAIGLIVVFNAVRIYRRSRYVEDLPTSSIRSAPTGLVEIEGHAAAAGETITSPFEERECVLCQYVVREAHSEQDSDRRSPFPDDYGLVGVPFYVEDDTGRLLVDPEGADVRIPRDLITMSKTIDEGGDPGEWVEGDGRYASGEGEADEPPVSSFAERRDTWNERYALTDRLKGMRNIAAGPDGGDDYRAIPDGTVRYAEARLEEGDHVYVLGTARSRSSGDESEGSSGDPGLVIAEAPESDRASSPIDSYFADRYSMGKYLRLGSDYRSIFLISSEDETNVVSTWRSKMWTPLIVGFVIFVLGLVSAAVFGSGVANP